MTESLNCSAGVLCPSAPYNKGVDEEASTLWASVGWHMIGMVAGVGLEGIKRTTPSAPRVAPNEGWGNDETRWIYFGFFEGPSITLDFANPFSYFILEWSISTKTKE